MKKIFISIIILSLIILTSFIKNSSKELDNKIYKLNAKIGSLNDKYDLIKLEYSYLTSPEKIEYLKNTYFDNTFEEKNINTFGEIIVKKNYVIIRDQINKINEK